MECNGRHATGCLLKLQVALLERPARHAQARPEAEEEAGERRAGRTREGSAEEDRGEEGLIVEGTAEGQRGFVALLDILGFSNLIASDQSSVKVTQYIKCLEQASNAESVDYVAFSDSIMVTAEGSDAKTFLAVAGACSRLMADLLAVGIPLRGAIAYGPFVRSSVGRSVFVAGRAVIDAYRFEQVQDWVGVMVAPSALEHLPDLDERISLNGIKTQAALREWKRWSTRIHKCHQIPFRSDNPLDSQRFDGFAVFPYSGNNLDLETIRETTDDTWRRLTKLRTLAPDPRTQKKYDAARSFISDVSTTWRHAVVVENRLREEGME